MMPDGKTTAEHGLKVACELQDRMDQAREGTRKLFRRKETNEQNILRMAIDSLVAAVAMRIDKPIANVSRETSYQIGLSATFIRTYFMVTDLLMSGDIVEALVLLRKQLEVLARIIELESKPVSQLHGRTPNIKNVLPNGTGRIYGFLSEVSHFATPEATEILGINTEGERHGPSLVPSFRDSAFGYMDLSHFSGIRFGQWVIAALCRWYPNEDFQIELRLAALAVAAAIKVGVLEGQEPVEDVQ